MNEVSLNGDSHIEAIPTIKQKALRINLNENIYGTFAEIGAGQETVRQFFRVGGASGTIAKAMSAYDKSFSDDIYGIENDEAEKIAKEANIKYLSNKCIKQEYQRLFLKSNPVFPVLKD